MSLSLTSLGWDESYQDAFEPYADSGLVPGRVGRPDRGSHLILTADGPVPAAPAPSIRTAGERDPLALPTVGDWVAVRSGEHALIEAVLPRRTAFVRRTSGNATVGHVLAANIDVVFLVVALHPAPNLRRIERFLALGWESGAQPVLVLSKADLCDDVEAAGDLVATAAPGVDIVPVSAMTGDGLDVLATYPAGDRTVALLGVSGVGKSTLVNSLLGGTHMTTTAIRSDGKGRHTTTHRELVPLPGGGVLIDTPGLRGLSLWDAEDGLEQAFSDVEELAGKCRFRDCAHDSEPGCAVTAAVHTGMLPARRLASYRHLQRELAHLARKQDARLASEERRRWKAIGKSLRNQPSRPQT